MRKDRHLAIRLRRQKKSYNEISRLLDIPKSTLHYWFKGNAWSTEVKNELTQTARTLARKNLKLMAIANKEKWEGWHKQLQQEAIKEFPEKKKNPLFLSGLMLYWGEGDKTLSNGNVRITNTDPAMIRIFYWFLRDALNISQEKINIRLILYPDLNDGAYKKFWGSVLDLPLSQFKKSIIILGRHPKRRISYGICNIEVYSRGVKEKIFAWLELCKNEFFINKERKADIV